MKIQFRNLAFSLLAFACILSCTKSKTETSHLTLPSEVATPTPTPTPTPSPLQTKYYAYATTTNSGNGIIGYALDPTTHTATLIAGSAQSAPSAFHHMAASSDGLFVYGISYSTPTAIISAFKVTTATGAVAPAATPSYNVTVPGPFEIVRVFKINGADYLFVSSSIGNRIYSYKIDSTNGGLTAVPGSPLLVSMTYDCQPSDLVMTPDSKYIYASCQHGGDQTMEGVVGYSVNQSTGAITALPGSPFMTATQGGAIYSLNLSPDGTKLFGAGINTPGGQSTAPIDVWAIATDGSIAVASGSPHYYTNIGAVFFGVIDPISASYYVLNPNNGAGAQSLMKITLNPTTYLPDSTATLVTSPTGLWGNMRGTSDGNFMAVTSTAGGLHFYQRTSSTGTLTEMTNSPFTGLSAESSVIVKVTY